MDGCYARYLLLNPDCQCIAMASHIVLQPSVPSPTSLLFQSLRPCLAIVASRTLKNDAASAFERVSIVRNSMMGVLASDGQYLTQKMIFSCWHVSVEESSKMDSAFGELLILDIWFSRSTLAVYLINSRHCLSFRY